MYTFLERSKNPNVISNAPNGEPTRKVAARIDFMVRAENAILNDNRELMEKLLQQCDGFPVTARKLKAALGK